VCGQHRIRTEGGKYFDFGVGGRDGFMMFQIICRIVCGARHFNFHVTEETMDRVGRFLQHRGAVTENFICIFFTQHFMDAEVSLQFQVRPVEQRIAEGVRNGGGPLSEFFFIRRCTGDIVFVDAHSSHRPPFVVVAFQPDLSDVLKPAVCSDISRWKVTVVVYDREVGGVVVVEPACCFIMEEEVFADQSFHFVNIRLFNDFFQPYLSN